MNARVEQPLRLVFANESSIRFHEVEDPSPAHMIVVHLPWAAPAEEVSNGYRADEDDDLANATWEDAEWQ